MIGIKHCSIALLFMAILAMLFTSPLRAQSREGARKQMNQGNYSTAITMLAALEELYPGQFSNELIVAKKCLGLQRSAIAKFKSHQYSEAVSLYNQLLHLNPNDGNAKQALIQCREQRSKLWEAEYAKCKTLSDYVAFAKRFPDSPQAKINIEALADENRWADAIRKNSIDSYLFYLKNTNKTSKHADEAKEHLRLLYIAQASSDYSAGKYSSARILYEKAMQYGTITSSFNQYRQCCEETDYSSLLNNPDHTKTDLERFLIDYPNSSHCSLVRGWLVELEMSSGNFDAARDIVRSFVVSSIESQTLDSKWWMEYIKMREREYNNSKYATTSQSSLSSQSFSRIIYSKEATIRVGETVTAYLPEGRINRWEIPSAAAQYVTATSDETLTAIKEGCANVWGYVESSPRLISLIILGANTVVPQERAPYIITANEFTMYVGDQVVAELRDGVITRWEIDNHNKDFLTADGKILRAKKEGYINVWGYVNDAPRYFIITINCRKE